MEEYRRIQQERLARFDIIPDPDTLRNQRLGRTECQVDAVFVNAALRVANERILNAHKSGLCCADVPLHWFEKGQLDSGMKSGERPMPHAHFRHDALIEIVRDRIAACSSRYRVKIKETVLRVKWN